MPSFVPRAASAGLCLCLCLAAARPAAGEGRAEAEACSSQQPPADGQSPVALMQLKTAVQRAQAAPAAGRASYPWFLPAMRTLVSTDPKKSAEFMTTYLRAKALPPPECSGVDSTLVEIDLGNGVLVKYQFIKDLAKKAGYLTPSKLVPDISAAWPAFANYSTPHLEWMDNHDAFPMETFLKGKAEEDGVIIRGLFALLRVYIPETMWTMEFVDAVYEPEPDLGFDSECRDLSMPFTYTTAWRKATFMTNRPMDAADFAVNVLGAVHLDTPYPPHPVESNPNCTVSWWVMLPGSGFHLHFAMHDSEPPSGPSIREFAAYLESLRGNYSDGVFDQYMYNSLVFPVSSLEPFAERLTALSVPFFVTQIGHDEYALFTDIPGTGITLQFRSAHIGVNLQPLPTQSCQTTVL